MLNTLDKPITIHLNLNEWRVRRTVEEIRAALLALGSKGGEVNLDNLIADLALKTNAAENGLHRMILQDMLATLSDISYH